MAATDDSTAPPIANTSQDAPPWHAAFPAPKAVPEDISASDLLALIRKSPASAPTYMLVDVRRTDHEGGTITTSLNLPAQSIYYSLGTLVDIVKATGTIKQVIFYCGSSRGRGPRCAGWFQDELNGRGIEDVRGCVLVGGIKGWVSDGREHSEKDENLGGEMLGYVSGYVSEYWDQFIGE